MYVGLRGVVSHGRGSVLQRVCSGVFHVGVVLQWLLIVLRLVLWCFESGECYKRLSSGYKGISVTTL